MRESAALIRFAAMVGIAPEISIANITNQVRLQMILRARSHSSQTRFFLATTAYWESSLVNRESQALTCYVQHIYTASMAGCPV